VQEFKPVKQVCEFLNAFHVYASDTSRIVETNHYCIHVNEDVRQCLLFDSPESNARLLGVEYMISKRLYSTLPKEERKLWHSHEFEVKSGMLIMPAPAGVPQTVWEAAETKALEDVVGLYGKTYHLWQVDRGDTLPLGPPQLMTSFTAKDQFDFDTVVGERDDRFHADYNHKAELRKDIAPAEIHQDADQAWKQH